MAILLLSAFGAGFWSGGPLWDCLGAILGHGQQQAVAVLPLPAASAPAELPTTLLPSPAEDVELSAALPPSTARVPLPKPAMLAEVPAVQPVTTDPVRELGHPRERATVRVAGEISASFYKAARRAALPAAAVDELVKLLSWDVDFQRDLQPGDRFEVLVEGPTDARGSILRSESLAYVALQLRDRRRIEAYRYTDRDGRTGYYDGEGRPLRKWLLRTPVDGARLSSLFGPRRHPVLRFTRMHKGIDFAAPTGTPVLAAAEGQIEFQGRNRGYGKYVRIRHSGGYSTAYAHLSRFAAGLGPGKRVQQGQVVGYVGSTGLSTGPHLHYEVLKDGVQVNPLDLKLASADALAGPDLRRFRQVRAELDALRDGLGGERLVAQESH
jgi:murein DD-endopeptidase MepM/ murein hydrolase activator NlpD